MQINDSEKKRLFHLPPENLLEQCARTAYRLGISFEASLAGDTNKDWYVDILDVIREALAFGSRSGDPNWNSHADLNDDNTINICDLVTIGVNFGAEDP